MRLPTNAERATHVRTLGRTLGVLVFEDPTLVNYGISDPTLRAVLVPTVGDEVSYAIALHELGHLRPTNHLSPVETHTNRDLLLMEELAAWDWARATALDWTPTMAHVAAVCLKLYAESAQAA